MPLSLFEKLTLGVAGLTASGVGIAILATPYSFFASYGIQLGPDPSLLSELRAPAAGLTAFGALMLGGIALRALSGFAILSALTVFLAFPAGRLIGIALDGMPSGNILWALVLELGIAALCLFAFRGRLSVTGSVPVTH